MAHSDGVDVAGVSAEGLLAGAFPQVPELGQRVAGSGDEGVHVGGQSQRHAVPDVVSEDHLLFPGLQVPQDAAGNTHGVSLTRKQPQEGTVHSFFNRK